MDFLTPEFFDWLIIINIVIGVLLVAWRLRQDFTRPMEAERSHHEHFHQEETQEIIPPPEESSGSLIE